MIVSHRLIGSTLKDFLSEVYVLRPNLRVIIIVPRLDHFNAVEVPAFKEILILDEPVALWEIWEPVANLVSALEKQA